MRQRETHRARQRARRRETARLADLSTIGLVFPVATVLGYLAGRTVGGWLGDAALGSMIGGALGIVAGFYNLVKVGRRLAREDEAAAAEETPAATAPQDASRPGDPEHGR
ncbi:MAG TPA: AtpZ/AtpI family protein [Thermoanaerobaculia bacterium]|nr:AtpZ/AtpI family protein [Thermoanaerobaculia bacterium]